MAYGSYVVSLGFWDWRYSYDMNSVTQGTIRVLKNHEVYWKRESVEGIVIFYSVTSDSTA